MTQGWNVRSVYNEDRNVWPVLLKNKQATFIKPWIEIFKVELSTIKQTQTLSRPGVELKQFRFDNSLRCSF